MAPISLQRVLLLWDGMGVFVLVLSSPPIVRRSKLVVAKTINKAVLDHYFKVYLG